MSFTRTIASPANSGIVLAKSFLVNDRWEVQEQIGEGGMSAVYAVVDGRGQQYAMKVIGLDFAGQTDWIKRFMREAKMCTEMVHANIIQVFHYGRINLSGRPGPPFLLMERLYGQGLNDYLAAMGGILTFVDAYSILYPVMDALIYAHETGHERKGQRYSIIHRDLKPENIFIGRDGHVTLLDFGIAKLRGDEDSPPETQLTEAGFVMGTPQYMPPEQLAGQRDQIGPWTDVFALGAILYEMVGGISPFAGESIVATMMNVTAHPPIPMPGNVAASLPMGLHAVLNKALAKQPGDRYRSVQDFFDVLQRIYLRVADDE